MKAIETFDRTAVERACGHAIKSYPNESCGFIVDGNYVPATNAAEDPTKDFVISLEEYQNAATLGTIQAVVHSHPDGPLHPTQSDMVGQISSGVPWIVVPTNGELAGHLFAWGDDLPIEPLIGREFKHGVHDCYSLVRDFFRQTHQIVIPEYPRDDCWWDSEEDLYTNNFKKAGFSVVSPDDIRDNDCFLLSINSQKLNHAGIYVGNNLILHHLPNRLSRREPAGLWGRHAKLWVRHEKFADA